MVLMMNCVLLLLVGCVVADGHPGGKDEHGKFDTMALLRRNVVTMKNLLGKQERRLAEGFKQLQRRVTSLDRMANKVEKQMTADHYSLNCTIPGTPSNGHILGLKYDASGIAHLKQAEIYFVCAEGFHLLGSESRKCLPSGNWTGDDVTCVDMEVRCGEGRCRNGGTCVSLSSGQVKCVCGLGFYGRNCESGRRQLDGNVRHSVCTGRGENKQCRCDPGFKMGANKKLCFDIDECENQKQPTTEIIPDDVGMLAKRAAMRHGLCRHKCVNTPGAYQCICPRGYETIGRECEDTNECTVGSHNCQHDQHCFNTGGSFECVRVTCPRNYNQTSTFICQRSRCDDDTCRKDPLTINFNFIDLPSSLPTPIDIYRMRARTRDRPIYNRFQLSRPYRGTLFGTRRLDSTTGILVLRRPLGGVHNTTVDVEVREMTKTKPRRLISKYVTRLTVFVSPYDF